MKPKTIFVLLASMLAAGALLLTAQQADITVKITSDGLLKLAVPDFRGAGDAQRFMQLFNDTLRNDLDGGGVLKLVAKSVYPLNVPQRPEDFVPPDARGQSRGPWLTDWSGSPVNANDLAFGYTAVSQGRLVLYGNLYNLSQAMPATARLFGPKTYVGSLNQEGARKIAHEFAADILEQFGAKSLADTKIYFVSDRTGPRTLGDGQKVGVKEIWSMDYDGSNQTQLTKYGGLAMMPAVSADGKTIAFALLAENENDRQSPPGWQVVMHAAETNRRLTFQNPVSSFATAPEFTPDGQRVLFATKIDNAKDANIFTATLQGGDLKAISHVAFIEEEPKVNPKTGSQIAYISNRTGKPQLWLMGIDGSNPEMLTTGEGDVSNPSWSPDGQFLAFSWTRGYEIGQFNIFIMDIGTRMPIQLTHDQGICENPAWAPDGKHLAFASTRGRVSQIYTMLVDGTHVQPVTTKGNNFQPVWAKGF